MGRNKFEDDARQKLSQREISPSAESWDRLNAMLAVAEEKKPANKYGWIYIAAAVLGFLFIGMMFLMQTQEASDAPRQQVAVGNATEKPKQKREAAQRLNQVSAEAVVTANPKAGDKQEVHGSKSNANAPIHEKVKQQYIAQNQNSQSPIISQKPEQATNAKVDELLAAVQSTENADAKSSVKVSVNSLLSQVDGELDMSFREKVIRKIKTAKVALANRNLQE